MLPLAILSGALVTVATAWAIGRTMLRATRVELYRWEEDALAFVTGSGILSLAIFILAALHKANKGALVALAIVSFAAAWRTGALRNTRPVFPAVPRLWSRLFRIVFAVFTVLYFFNAMAPEFSADAYHLTFVRRYADARGFVRMPGNMYSHLSQGIELLFLMAYSFGRHSAASLVHYAFLLALTLSIASYGRRAGHPVAGLAAALLVYVSPVIGADGTTAYIDVAVAAILFAVFQALEIWDGQRSRGLLILAALTAGFAYAAKYTAGVAVPYAMGFVLWRTRKLWTAGMVAACALVPMVPWMVKNIVWAWNPFAPMFNAWFPNPWVHISFEQGWTHSLRTYGLADLWTLPLEVTAYGETLCGFIGPAFLLLPVGLAALRQRAGRRILAAGAIFAAPYFLNIGTRFLIPALPYLALSLSLALSELPVLLFTLLMAHAILSWPQVSAVYTAAHPWRLGRIPVLQALRIEPQDKWLSRKEPEYAVTKLFETMTPPGARIFTLSGIAGAHTTRDVRVQFQSAEGELAADIFNTAFLGDFQPRCSEQLAFPPTVLRKIRVVQTAGPVDPLQWNVGEMRLYSDGGELPRESSWRLTAKPNPWDVELAFDNSPATRWRSWERFRPGMYIEVDFGARRTIDAVHLDGPYDCTAHAERIEGMTADGGWTTLASERKVVATRVSPFMGTAAMRELKLRGYDYVFLRKGEFGWAEVLEHPEAWKLTALGQAAGGTLYRVDAGLPELESK
jgi:hypothetical protein